MGGGPGGTGGAGEGRYLPIAEHGLIGDLRSAALVGTDGTIDWYCCPRFDAPSVFASILDADRGGCFELAADGAGADQAVLLPRHQRPDHPVLRRRRGRRDPGLHAGRRRLGRGRPAPADPPGGVRPRIAAVPRAGGAPLRLRRRSRTPSRMARRRGGVRVRRAVARADRHRAARGRRPGRAGATSSSPRASRRCSPSTRSAATWRRAGCAAGRGGGAVRRDGALLAALAVRVALPRPVAGDGAPLRAHAEAAHLRADRRDRGRADDQPARADRRRAQLGLPLRVGPRRRLLRLRAAAAGLHRGGRGVHGLPDPSTSARGDGGPPARCRSCTASTAAPTCPSASCAHLEGYRGSAPVRVGNAAADQLQLDIYGALIDSDLPLRQVGQARSPATSGTSVCALVDWVCEHWDQPDEGVWETRGRPQELPVLAADVLGGDRTGHPDGQPPRPARRPAAAGGEARDAIYRRIMQRGWSAERGRRSSSTRTATCSTPPC